MDFGTATQAICQNTLGVCPEDLCESVLLSPGWTPDRLFAPDTLRPLTDFSPLHGYRLWNVEDGAKRFTYLRAGFGAPMVLDAVYLLRYTPCKRIMFVSSGGALSSSMRAGDLLLPEISASGDGASRYLQKDLLADTFGEIQRPDSKLFQRLYSTASRLCAQQNVALHLGCTFCVDTIAAQQAHIPHIRSMGYNSLDMESAAAFKAARQAGIAISAILLISDTQEQPLSAGRSEQDAAYRRRVRSVTLPAILNEVL